MANETARLQTRCLFDLLVSFQRHITSLTAYSNRGPGSYGSRFFCRGLFSAGIFLLIGWSASLQAQNYNPNNYDTAKTIQEMEHPHNDLVLIAAHRGLHATLSTASGVPENSLQAIGLAAQQGIEIVEVDIKLTEDGVSILSHDVTWGREWCGLAPVPYLTTFNPFIAPGNYGNDLSNPAVSATSLSNTRSFVGQTELRDSVSIVNGTQNQGCTAGVLFAGPYPPTLQDVLNYMTNKIAAVLALDIKDDAAAQACWNLVKAHTDYRGRPYSQSVVFKMPGRVYKSVAAFAQAFGNDYTSVLFWPFYGTNDISPGTSAIDNTYGTESALVAGFGNEYAITYSIGNFQQSPVQLVGTEVNLKQPGGILTTVLAAAKRNDSAPASVGSFNPEAKYIDPSDTTRTAQFFWAAGPNAAHCCYKLADFYYDGAPSNQPSDTADDRGDLNFSHC